MNRFIGVVSVAGIVAGLGWYFSANYRFEARMVSVCEDLIKERLVSFSSYKRERPPEFFYKPGTLEAHLGWDSRDKREWDEEMMARHDASRRLNGIEREIFDGMDDPTEIVVFIEYTGRRLLVGEITAPSKCSIVVSRGDMPDREDLERNLRVDSFTDLEYSLYRAGQLSR
ncbi:hypothetical protein [Mameliella alba]|nr:hypothetical protein [Mameliella alba]